MVIASAYAGRALEAAGRFDEALARYRDSFRSWNNFPDQVGATGGYSAERIARAERDPAYVSRGEIERRIDQLSTSLLVPGGVDLERGRDLMHQGRNSEAIAILEPLVRKLSTTAVGLDALAVLHRARLEEAIALVDTGNAAPDSVGALKILDALSQQPFDSSVALASIAAATIRRLQGDTVTADRAMPEALRRWVAEASTMQPPAENSLEADVLAIRDAVFLPLGGGLLAKRWNGQNWPEKLPLYLLAPSELRVKLAAAGIAQRVKVSRQPLGLTNVVFISSEDVEYLTRLVPRLGGIQRREPTAIMEVPNQPLGDARSIIRWWSGFYPARPGHWSGYDLLTSPAFTSIEFTNPERTRALVPVTVGYSGATIVLEKVNGAWTMKEIVNYWVM